MKKITLHVNDQNLMTVMSILENLKAGLIERIDTDTVKMNATQKVKTGPSYVPKTGTVVKEGSSVQGKYINPREYKKRLEGKK